ncbi:hypothetical protein BpOF4_11670 [Alkalihalophilus pseudofirmus OF4]|uniref:DUF2905 domain-containing protein n=1 Tax=Alkalihalophilus pseudofirmus (strain ATCC BAA-2126 / JCM 17055 / OF4) TaxID=398511 RepID=D3FVV5_ALKPO|nr:DUF2905 domain-containing protein [Alkalihalophilus pseudofirmus]ADC50387.1 hypothetical protein BpOF4_11670 [Alkalihalophilus pseudofirmus OF4]
MSTASKVLIAIGVLCIIIGILWPIISKTPIGRLPGDILIKRENSTFYFPIMTSIVISIVLSLILFLFERFR